MLRSWLHSLIGWIFASRDKTYAQFGAFADVLKSPGEPVPLVLLSMRSMQVGPVIARIERALSVEGAIPAVEAMLANPDWRTQLVGALALILDGGRRLSPTALWAAIDAGSWVTPQLVATGYLVDPAFPARVRERLEANCSVVVPANLSAVERHRATGPATAEQRSAKLLASLVRIGMLVPALTGWLRTAASRPELAALQAADRDKSGNIAENWLKSVQTHLKSRSRAPVPGSGR